MEKEDYERELHKLYNMAMAQEKVELCVDILGQLQHYDFSLPPLVVPDDITESSKDR